MTTTIEATTPNLPARRKEFLVHYLFYEPVEQLLYQALRDRYPKMTVGDIVVCRAVYIDRVISGGEFRHILDRRHVWSLYNTPREEWARYVVENKRKVAGILGPSEWFTVQIAQDGIQKWIDKEGLSAVEDHTLFSIDSEDSREDHFEEMIGLARLHGYISYRMSEIKHSLYWNKDEKAILPNAEIVLHEDIVNLLDKTTDQAVQTDEYVSDDQLLRHEQELAECDRRHAAASLTPPSPSGDSGV